METSNPIYGDDGVAAWRLARGEGLGDLGMQLSGKCGNLLFHVDFSSVYGLGSEEPWEALENVLTDYSFRGVNFCRFRMLCVYAHDCLLVYL